MYPPSMRPLSQAYTLLPTKVLPAHKGKDCSYERGAYSDSVPELVYHGSCVLRLELPLRCVPLPVSVRNIT